MAAPPSIDRQTFLTYLRQSRLVSEAQFARITRRFSAAPNGRSLARALVAESILTRFQAERLLMGRTAGFLLGQYRILEPLGRGGMGRVYKAEHLTMGRTVALKVLSSELLATERAVELFLHEVRAVSQLVHPNIVTAFDANEVGGRYYLVLEFVDGPNLDQLVRKQGALTVGLACDYIKQVASGLQCAHARGMVHRDIKPANILVQWHGLSGDDSPGLVKISDFGLARIAKPTTGKQSHHGTILVKDNTVMGTPDYLSPEQSRNLHKADIRSDIYSLGCTFYFLLTGSVPYPGGTPIEKLIRHATDRPTPIEKVRSDVPAAVVGIVEKMMTRDPHGRYATPGTAADALLPYAVSGPTPWAPQARTPELYIDSLATPTPGRGTPSDEMDTSDGELSAMSNTVGGDQSPTPVGVTPRRVRRAAVPRTTRKLRTAVLVAIGIVGGLLALTLAVAALAR